MVSGKDSVFFCPIQIQGGINMMSSVYSTVTIFPVGAANDDLENKRNEMNKKAELLGINHPEVLRLSEEIDILVNQIMVSRFLDKGEQQ